MITHKLRVGLVAGALLVAGCFTVGTAVPAAAETPAVREPSVAVPEQECIYRVLTATTIDFGSERVLLQPGMELHGPNDLGWIYVYSYTHGRSGWVYRDYFNLQIVGCDP